MTHWWKEPMEEPAPSDAARRILERLREGVCRRVPAWRQVGPEDPSWAMLEVFAQALGEARSEIEGLEERLYPRLLEALGEEPRWASAAEGGVVFQPDDSLEQPAAPSRHGKQLPDLPGETCPARLIVPGRRQHLQLGDHAALGEIGI